MERLLPDEIETARLRLRRPHVADASVIFAAYAQDPEVCRYVVWKPHESELVTKDFLVWCASAWETGATFPYVITERHSDSAIGMIVARIQGTTVDLGYVLARAHWGKEFMPEAISKLTQAVIGHPQFFRAQASCCVNNKGSQRALEKAGFNREGRLERYTVHPNISPEPSPCFMYSKCR